MITIDTEETQEPKVPTEPKKRIKLDPDAKYKLCPNCNETLPIDNFGIEAKTPDGRRTYCRGCVSKINHSGLRLTSRQLKLFEKNYPEAFRQLNEFLGLMKVIDAPSPAALSSKDSEDRPIVSI